MSVLLGVSQKDDFNEVNFLQAKKLYYIHKWMFVFKLLYHNFLLKKILISSARRFFLSSGTPINFGTPWSGFQRGCMEKKVHAHAPTPYITRLFYFCSFLAFSIRGVKGYTIDIYKKSQNITLQFWKTCIHSLFYPHFLLNFSFNNF